MKITQVFSALVCALILLGASGCSSSSTSKPPAYPVTRSGAVSQVEYGTVISSRETRIDGRKTVVGQAAGASIGAAIGSVAVPQKTTVIYDTTPSGGIVTDVSSNGGQRAAAMIVGGVVGSVVGPEVEKMMTARKVQELAVAMEDGSTKIILQEIREPDFYPDERVKVVTTGMGREVVYHIGENPGVDPDTNAYLVGETDEEEEYDPVTW